MDFTLPSYEQAAALITAYATQAMLRLPSTECVELSRANGRVLARPLLADADQPPFDRSIRDGFACHAIEASAHVELNIAGTTRAGETSTGTLPRGAAWEIMTGAPVPAGADAVAMVEHVEYASSGVRLLPPRTLVHCENIVARGAQARTGDLLLPCGIALGPTQISLAAACGHAHLRVYKRPRVAILTTGDELVPVEASPGPGQIRNSNASMLAAMVANAGGDPWVLPTAADNAQSLDVALREAVKADLLLLSGGVSAGKFDLVESALSRAGAIFHFTGVHIQPGKSLVFGELPCGAGIDASTLAFFGLPGNPASTAVTFLLFAAPVLSALAGKSNHGPRFSLARLTKPIERKDGLTRFLPALCNFCASINALPEVALVPWKGSGDLAAVARSNCFLVVPEQSLDAGDIVRVLLP